jgi:hypothetical protein
VSGGNGGGEKCLHSSVRKLERKSLGNLVIDGRRILKWILLRGIERRDWTSGRVS